MFPYATGLTELRTDELKKLLLHVHREELSCPITTENLARVGFQHRHDEIMGALRGVAQPGVRAVLVCVLAERPKSDIATDDSFLF